MYALQPSQRQISKTKLIITARFPSPTTTKVTLSPLLYLSLWYLGTMVQMVKNLPAMQETQAQSLGQENPLEKEWQPTSVFLPGKSHGQRSLAAYSLWGR